MRQVTLTIRVEQKDLGEDCVTETRCLARMDDRNGKYYLTYRETGEETGEISSLIRAGGGRVEIIRHGAAESHMILQEGERTAYMLDTPAGPMRVETETSLCSLREDNGALRIEAVYDLFLDGIFISACKAWITADDAETGCGR